MKNGSFVMCIIRPKFLPGNRHLVTAHPSGFFVLFLFCFSFCVGGGGAWPQINLLGWLHKIQPIVQFTTLLGRESGASVR